MRTSSTSSPIRVVAIDDSIFTREGIRAILNLDRSMTVVGEAGTRAGALNEVHRTKPDVVLMDMRLPDGTGSDACRDILSAYPHVRILFFSAYRDDHDLYTAITAGGHGYLTKDASAKNLLRAIKTIAAGRSLIDQPPPTTGIPASTNHQVPKTPTIPPAILSPVDLTLLSLLAEGASNKTIATCLQKTPSAITKLLSGLYKRLNLHRRSQAIRHFNLHIGRCRLAHKRMTV